MADQQHLERLRQGVSTWNAWRAKQLLSFQPDLRGANLSEADLRGADLSRATLSEADLIAAILIGANLSEADLRGAYLSGAHLSEADLRGAYLIYADLSEASLIAADLSAADLIAADLSGAYLSGAYLSGAHLSRAHLSGARLIAADLNGADLRDADLSRANLKGADLRGAYLRGADLRGADLSEAKVGWTIFGNVDLRTVKGLETLRHEGPSTIGTDTIVRSQGNIPEAFLRGAGLPDTFIDYARSLVQSPIQYYTCFLSYSSRDQDFVERLYADLQSKGVRCWFAPEDMKTGERMRQRIDESIRLYDKLLLVLSQHSMVSAWVEFEVEAALAKENERKTTVLFPIRLDTSIMQSTTSWARHLQRTRHITDFTRWKQHGHYQKAFKRLLRDLQPEQAPKDRPE